MLLQKRLFLKIFSGIFLTIYVNSSNHIIKTMTINDETVSATEFAYDGCHKIYLIEDMQDRYEADGQYSIFPISKLKEAFDDSCELRFITNWKLSKNYVEQFEEAVFED